MPPLNRALPEVTPVRFWRSVEEARGAPVPVERSNSVSVTRRDFMKWMAASLALSGSGCARPPREPIVPYRDGPAQATYGKPVYYATTLERGGYGVGVLVETHMGRPTKIEGNPDHPASLGATDAITQALVLELWDPDRSTVVRTNGLPATWDAFVLALRNRLARLGDGRGARLRILTETITSPSLGATMADVLTRYPGARWHRWQPEHRDGADAGTALAYGEPLETVHRFDQARVILALDADFLVDGAAGARHARDFATRRGAEVRPLERSRLYALECTPGLTGANADHRLALRSGALLGALRAIAVRLGALPAGSGTEPPSPLPAAWLEGVVRDLAGARGASIVIAGERQPAVVHACAALLNAHLGNVGTTLMHVPVVAQDPIMHEESLRDLVEAMRGDEVDTLVIVGANPVHTAHADLDFESALAHVPFKVHHGLYVDETAARCDWHVPAAHDLESWGDARAFDGTLGLRQPCIAPLYAGRSRLELLAALAGDANPDGYGLFDAYWKAQLGDRPGARDAALRAGVVAESAYAATSPAIRADAVERVADALARASQDARSAPLELAFVPDPRIGDGRHANNAWLQELPKPLSQLTWDNAAHVAPALAARLGLANDEVVELAIGTRRVEAPVWILPGMPDGAVMLHLGYGRAQAGRVGSGHGANAYALRTRAGPWFADGVTLSATGRRHVLACTQTHASMEGRDIVRMLDAADAARCAAPACSTPHAGDTLYESPPLGPYAWAMSIDQSSCIGCGACTIACQAENNIPVVGRDEVIRGREMHWIRVDRYYEGAPDAPRTVFQPVPCMQCEHAPCEVVCPVEAAVHDSQGINVQVYNRCVGTRFCSNNCPYKVRRFNFFQYAKDEPALDAQRNPEVTVRMRGVMEKCNYCLQRVTTARIAADRESRHLRDGEVVTACQAVCPTRAIVFGDLSLRDSAVSVRKRSPLDYALLAELNTRPRTTYLPRVVNPGHVA